MTETADYEIVLVPIGEVDRELLDYLTLVLPGTFGRRCNRIKTNIDARVAYNPARQQYHSTHLLRTLHESRADPHQILLGVTEFDLFIPIFTFVFGEAQFGGSVALMSVHRLRQEYYGLPGNRQLFFGRAEKEAAHELGHVFGLAHCRGFDCVMRFSNSVEDVDMKADVFCIFCDAQLRAHLNSTMAA